MTATTNSIQAIIDAVKDEVITYRRYLHQNPELSFEEEKTSQYIYDQLQSFGNIELTRPTKTSVVGRIIGAAPGKVVAIRADMDALPIQEENDVEYASTNPGVMHACGHDGHTAMLLGAAKVLSSLKDQLHGEIRLLFQHAEELFPGGAEEMVQAGVMDGVDTVIGAHLWSPLEIGKIGIVYGPMMASPDTFYLTVNGKGGHAALPHQTVDSIAVASQVVTNLQHIVSRNTDPLDNLVLSVTKFIGGTTHNVIPGSVEICGTVRSFDPDLRKEVPKLMERVIKGITEAHGAAYEFNYEFGYRPVINDARVTEVLEATVAEVYGEEAIDKMKPNMGGEDFSAFQQVTEGSFFYIGAGNPEKNADFPHHHARFEIDEDSLEKGVNLFVYSAIKLLEA
ncbi:M20 family metallopeptidase [Niallia taxi]|uniref:Amidohydrolase n=1 Tax=Niallia taxi TaxID=2499688 RepID=A0A3S2TUU6_9BACI|nr:M20 family metallopeptidase [Niallia taxi]MCM3214210.1 M20 family metallopeptidase [Niallia taxi]MDK8640826.1 M20 family metallopeptidase [Niallia taxi]MED4040827.1 M20 family metallopeptidase [Niallia taxi]MED4052753.1 M20 family metallopeptidase [Niallia taxi]MED4120108.1 M20 family metallopeptidase [Niallia taxi]